MTEMYETYEGVETFETENVDVVNAWKLLSASKKRNFVAVQISPAVRVSIGEKIGLRRGEGGVGKVAAALMALGADVVVDTAIMNDALTLMKTQALRAKKETGEGLPMYSSECTVWVDFAKENYPEIAEEFFPSATSMSAKLLKKYYGEVYLDKKIRVIAVEMGAGKKADAGVDVVLTVEELAQVLDASGLNVRLMKKVALETPFGVGSGAGYVQAASGGDAEAIARVLSADKTPNTYRKLEYCGIYDKKDRREVALEFGGEVWKFAIVDTLAAAEALMADIQAGAEYDYVEVTACQGGQIGLGCDLSDADGEMTRRLRKLGLKYLDFSRAARAADASFAVEMVIKAWKALVRSGKAAEMDVIDEIVDDPEILEELMEEIVEELTQEAVEEAVQETVEEVAETIAEELAEEIAEEFGDVLSEEIIEEIVEDAVEEVLEEAAEEAIEEIVEEVAEAVVEDLADGVADSTVEEIIEEVVAETIAEIVEETAEEVAATIAEELVEEVVETEIEQMLEEIVEVAPEPVEEVVPVEDVIEEVAATEETPVEEIEEVVEETPVEEVEEVVEETPVEEVEEVVEETPVEEVEEVVEETPVEEVEEVVEETPVEEVEEVVEETPVEEIEEVVEETPVEEVEEVVEETPVEEVEEVVEETPVEEIEEVVEETPVEEVEEEPIEEVVQVSQEEVQAEMEHVEEMLNVAEEDLTPAQKAARNAYYRRLSTKERRKLKRLRRNNKKQGK